MNSKISKLGLLALLVVFGLSPSISLADPEVRGQGKGAGFGNGPGLYGAGDCKGMGSGGPFAGLNLTESQKSTIQKNREERQQRFAKFYQERMANHFGQGRQGKKGCAGLGRGLGRGAKFTN